jgi:hypothetical protein
MTAARNEHICALIDEEPCRSQPDAHRAASDDGLPSSRWSLFFSLVAERDRCLALCQHWFGGFAINEWDQEHSARV